MTRLAPGQVIENHQLQTINEARILVPDPDRLTHLLFRRYAGCPVCNLHLRSFAHRHDEITAAGVQEVVVFHSTVAVMRSHQPNYPFAVIADPNKTLYEEFGVGKMSPGLMLSPRSWLTAVGALARAPSLHGAAGRGEEHLGLPADFLIAQDGELRSRRYGKRVDDHWSVDELLSASHTRAAACPGDGTG